MSTAGALLAGVLASAASPSPGSTDLPRGLEPTDVSPGVAGFLATAFVVVLSIFLIQNLVTRMRRIRHRAALEEARELAARAGEDDGRGSDRDLAAPGGAALGDGHPVVQGEVRQGPAASPPPATAERDEPDTPRQAHT